jgi:hypothetical protein
MVAVEQQSSVQRGIGWHMPELQITSKHWRSGIPPIHLHRQRQLELARLLERTRKLPDSFVVIKGQRRIDNNLLIENSATDRPSRAHGISLPRVEIMALSRVV